MESRVAREHDGLTMVKLEAVTVPEHHVFAVARKTARGKTAMTHIVPQFFEGEKHWPWPSGKALCGAQPGSGWNGTSGNIDGQTAEMHFCLRCEGRAEKLVAS